MKLIGDPKSYADSKEEVSHYRPIPILFYYFVGKLGGQKPFVYHLFNILMQCLACGLLFLLLDKILRDKPTAFWTSAFFSVHPIQIACVTYISGLAEILSTIFLAGTFYFYLRSNEERSYKHLLFVFMSSVTYLLALFSKELMIVIPILLLGYYYIFRHEYKIKMNWLAFIGYAAVFIFYVFLRLRLTTHLGEGAQGGIPFNDRIFICFSAICGYLRVFLLPYNLHLSYQFPRPSFADASFLMGLLLFLVLFCLAWLSRKKLPVFFGWVWFCVFLFPILNLFFLLYGPMAEHWFTDASIGLLIMLFTYYFHSWKVSALFKKISEGVLAICLVAYAMTTFHTNFFWKDNITFYENNLKYADYRADLHHNLGLAYSKKGMLNKAEEQFEKERKVMRYYESRAALKK